MFADALAARLSGRTTDFRILTFSSPICPQGHLVLSTRKRKRKSRSRVIHVIHVIHPRLLPPSNDRGDRRGAMFPGGPATKFGKSSPRKPLSARRLSRCKKSADRHTPGDNGRAVDFSFSRYNANPDFMQFFMVLSSLSTRGGGRSLLPVPCPGINEEKNGGVEKSNYRILWSSVSSQWLVSKCHRFLKVLKQKT